MLWFKDTPMLDVPLVFVDERDKMFSQTIHDYDISQIKKIPADDKCSLNETAGNDSLVIITSCIGKPLLVKIPYFPDWSVEGADKIYLASPGFMLIFPSQENVKLKYGSASNLVGNAFTMSGLVFVAFYLISAGFRKKFQYYGRDKHVGKHKRNV